MTIYRSVPRLEYNKFGMAEHTGTHMDAPSHFGKDRWRVHQIPSSHLVGPGVVIDVTEKVNGNADYAITVDDLKVCLYVLGLFSHALTSVRTLKIPKRWQPYICLDARKYCTYCYEWVALLLRLLESYPGKTTRISGMV